MNSVDFIVGDKTYRLSLTTRGIVQLERRIGCNPIMLFTTNGEDSRIPTVTEMVMVLHSALTRFNHGITLDNAYDIFDDYIADGHDAMDLIPVIIELYQVSGLMPKDEEEKNA